MTRGVYQGVMGFAFGGRGYFLPKSSIVRPRITFLYGTVGVLEKTTFNYSSYKLTTSRDPINGTALGLGFNWKYSPKWGMDLDLLHPFYNQPAGSVKSGGDLKISIGLGYYFVSKGGGSSKK